MPIGGARDYDTLGSGVDVGEAVPDIVEGGVFLVDKGLEAGDVVTEALGGVVFGEAGRATGADAYGAAAGVASALGFQLELFAAFLGHRLLLDRTFWGIAKPASRKVNVRQGDIPVLFSHIFNFLKGQLRE